jgi:DHA1 family tetracycline resistance protein-like MFS transporter
LPSTVVLYAIYRYHWGPSSLGLTLALVGVALIIVQVLVVGRSVRIFGQRASLVAGLAFGAAGLFIAGFSKTGAQFWMGIPILALWGVAGAACQGIMTRHVTASEQGQLQGANASLVGIVELVGPLIFPFIFAYYSRPGVPIERSGAPFLLAGIILIAAAAWAFVATRREKDYVPPGK